MPFQLAEMKEKERIFMFTANIALKTIKKGLQNTKRKLFKFPKTGSDESQKKSIELVDQKEKECGG